MINKSDTTQSPTDASKKRSNLKKMGIKALVALLAIGAVLAFFDIQSRINYSSLNDSVKNIEQDLTSLPSAVSQDKLADSGGDGLIDSLKCIPDLRCPYVYRGWVVGIANGNEEAFVESLLQKHGYAIEGGIETLCRMEKDSDTCTRSGNKDGRRVDITVKFADSFHHTLPKSDPPASQTWRFVSINAATFSK